MGFSNEADAQILIDVDVVKSGVQFYSLTLHVYASVYRVLARYKELEAFRQTVTAPIRADFPEKSGLFGSKNPEAKVIERKAKLQEWFSDVLEVAHEALFAFFGGQNSKYRDQQITAPLPNLNNGNERNEHSHQIPPLYHTSALEHTLSRWNVESKKWEVLCPYNINIPRHESRVVTSCYYDRCIFVMDNLTLFLNYAPWGISMKVINTSPKIIGSIFSFYQTGMTIHKGLAWFVAFKGDRNFGSFNLQTCSWQYCTSIPSDFNDNYTIGLVGVGDNIHLIGNVHYAFNTVSHKWTRLNPPNWHKPGIYTDFVRCARAREYIFAAYKNDISCYNIITDTWKKIGIECRSVAFLVWNTTNLLYTWVRSDWIRNLTCIILNMDTWQIIYADEFNIKTAISIEDIPCTFFFTYELDFMPVEDQKFETHLFQNYILPDKYAWNNLPDHLKILRQQMSKLENTKSDERATLVRKPGSEFVKILTDATNDICGQRAIVLIFHLLKQDPSLAAELSEIVYIHFTKMYTSDGKFFYVPNNKRNPGLWCHEPSSSSTSSSSPSPPSSSSSPSSSSPSPSSSSPSPSSSHPSTTLIQQNFSDNSTSTSTSTSAPSATVTSTSFSASTSQNTREIFSKEEVLRRKKIISQLKSKEVQIPEAYKCPLTKEIIFDPVVATDGHIYEKDAILQWFENGNSTSPVTNQLFPSFTILPVHTFKNLITNFLAAQN